MNEEGGLAEGYPREDLTEEKLANVYVCERHFVTGGSQIQQYSSVLLYYFPICMATLYY